MKIRDTLSATDMTRLFNRMPVRFFENLFNPQTKYYDLGIQAQTYYYLQRSGNKTVSPFYDNLINSYTPYDADLLLSLVIEGRYNDKWDRLYDALVLKEYDPLEDYSRVRDISRDTDETNTSENGTVIDGNNGSKITTSSSAENVDDVYGFNSEESVHSGKSNSSGNETVVGNSSDNTSHNEETYTGSSTSNVDDTVHEQTSGRNSSAQKLINDELRLRNITTFLDIVCSDIDSVTTINIYL